MTDEMEPHAGTEGFFQVGTDRRGVWWFVDPEGRRFFAKAVAGVNRAGTQGGRLAKDGPYAETVDRLYDYPVSPDRFVDSVHERLRAWGFNSHGAWITPEFFDRGTPYTDILECVKQVGPEHRLKGPGLNVPDVFDPAFADGVERIAARLCPPRRDKTGLMGYFTDNELGWGQPGTDHIWGASAEVNRGGRHPTLLQACLALNTDRPAHRVAWEWSLSYFGGRDAMARALGMDQADAATVQKQTAEGMVLDSEAYGKAHHAFSVYFAREYFRVTGEAIRRHDPNHLIMGCRFGAPPGAAIAEAVQASDFVDVVSVNNYRDRMTARLDAYAAPMAKPLFIGEYAWASDYHTRITDRDSCLRGLAPERVAEIKGRAALRQAFAHPAVVGVTWYRWVQNPRKDGAFDQQGYGLVGLDDRPNPFNVRILSEENPKAEALHAGEARPGTVEDIRGQVPTAAG